MTRNPEDHANTTCLEIKPQNLCENLSLVANDPLDGQSLPEVSPEREDSFLASG